MIHRRNILKTSIATFFGLSIGTGQAGLFSSPQCGTKCSYKSNHYKVGGPDRWGGPNTVDGHTHLQYYNSLYNVLASIILDGFVRPATVQYYFTITQKT